MLSSNSFAPRRGISLVEVLLTIAILLALAFIVFPAVMEVRATALEGNTRVEIKDLSDACEAFKLRYGVYPPSSILLREKDAYLKAGTYRRADDGGYFNVPDDQDLILRSVFKGIDPNLYQTTNGREWHDWNGNGVADDGDVGLCGYQCIVFFLGGIPKYNAASQTWEPQGLGKDKTRPTRIAAGVGREQFFEFDPSRLVASGHHNAGNAFPVYLDLFGKPYVYFRAELGDVGGTPGERGWIYVPGHNPEMPAFMAKFKDNGTCDPYFRPEKKNNQFDWYNRQSFQIISSGRDQNFGRGGDWPPINPSGSSLVYQEDIRYVRDNLSNFCEGRLGQLLVK